MSKQEYFKFCSSCGAKQSYTTQRACAHAIKKNTCCPQCVIRTNPKNGTYRGILISWVDDKRRKAIGRGIEFSIDIKYIYRLYMKQGKKCALTGVDLYFAVLFGGPSNVSMDRINSKKGYVKGNVQLVTKTANFAKHVLSQEDFIKICNLVAKKHPRDVDSELTP